MRIFRKILKIILGILFIPPLIYMVMVLIGAVIPVNKDTGDKGNHIKIYLISNGMHTDIVVPVRNEFIDWTSIVKPEHTPGVNRSSNYLSFGWGDLGFYRDTPQWEDLTLDTGFKALFLKTPSAVHATFLEWIDEGEDTRMIYIDNDQYKKLVNYIADTFEYDPAGNSQPVPNLHYSQSDAFYKAKGSLHLFKTCNTWVNTGLKKAGMKACLWTPFVEGIFLRYPE